jgi:hypothetical protein
MVCNRDFMKSRGDAAKRQSGNIDARIPTGASRLSGIRSAFNYLYNFL